MKRAAVIFNILNFFFSLAAIGTLVWYHGYTYRPDHLHDHLIFLHVSFAFYLVQFAFRAYRSGKVKEFLARNRIEYFLFLVLILSMVTNWFMDFSVIRWTLSFTGIEDTEHLFVLSLHIFLLIIVGIELGRVATRSTIWKLPPPALFILSFLVLIAIGSSLLMLPEMTTDGKGMSFVDALFTSVSANCVTGLTVVDTATFFSAKGHFVLLMLIQAGGLNIIFFATFFISRYHQMITTRKDDRLVGELLNSSSLRGEETKVLLKRVIITSLVIEFIGALVIFNQMGDSMPFAGNPEKIFHSVFHSVSAFNNAGFTLLPGGLTNSAVATNYSLHISMAVLIVLGGIGFTVIWDLVDRGRAILRREALNPLRLDTRIALISASCLIIIGGILFYWFEKSHTLEPSSAGGNIAASLFQSVTTRTAGFNTVEIGSLGLPAMVLMLILMFIGASSGSTGGGIKTSTVAVLGIAIVNRIRGKTTNGWTAQITRKMIRKAGVIFLCALIVILAGTTTLCFTEEGTAFSDLLFEEVSAFGTVGLSRGVTPDLTTAGKSIVTGTMLIGRVGPLTLAYALIRDARFYESTRIEGFMIG